jgi:hypothetical protein
LGATLLLSDNSDDRANGRKLKKQLLLPYEWDLLKQIVDLLGPFDDATTYFSGTSYATLSIIYPLIQVLKFKYAYEEDENEDNEDENEDDDEDDNNSEIEQGKLDDFEFCIVY